MPATAPDGASGVRETARGGDARDMEITAYSLALRFVGTRELGAQDNPFIQWAHSLCGFGPDEPDETPWCSAFVNAIAWMLRLPRSKSAAARSWLDVGTPVALSEARPGCDVVVFWRGSPAAATGHVAFFAGLEGDSVLVLGGNQGDCVSVAKYPVERVLGCRRLA